MIGNIPKAICCKPSSGAQVLVGYPPTVELEGSDLSTNAAHIIVGSIIVHGRDGIMLTGGDGQVCNCFPILACYVADYPDDTTRARFGANQQGNLRVAEGTLRHLQEAKLITTVKAATNFLKRLRLTNVLEPFWECPPHVDIHKALTPPILHQLYQGLVKHIIGWLEKIVGPTELDAWIQRLPPAHALHHFKDGITHLTCVSGTEHKQMCKQILGCIIGVVPVEVVKATQTLKLLQHALNEFHKHKTIFLKVGAQSGVLTCLSMSHCGHVTLPPG
ncbi:hypothetical protein K439DRAFT_1649918 [Ramaria rubella]|nr:hypothetical protein K439DRAFT_1650097 [Ramaria rubella]KAF8573800.1 hypothetical protein K439DRAFT_1649918 [Ramaria rubella]